MANTLYMTHGGERHDPNEFGCSIGFAVSDDRTSYCFSVLNFQEVLNSNAYAVLGRDELKLLYDAIGAELKATEN
jgi:hypothetical protein